MQRVDVFQSSRHVRVVLNGHEVASTTRPRFLFETSLRRRTYIPKVDCKMEWLTPSQLTTECPYKVIDVSTLSEEDADHIVSQGVANYYDVRLPDGTTAENSVWWYRNSNPECIEIRGLVAFYDEKFDVFVDGELQPR